MDGRVSLFICIIGDVRDQSAPTGDSFVKETNLYLINGSYNNLRVAQKNDLSYTAFLLVIEYHW